MAKKDTNNQPQTKTESSTKTKEKVAEQEEDKKVEDTRVSITKAQLDTLMQRISDLEGKGQLGAQTSTPVNPQTGRPQSVIYKYPVEPSGYPDPSGKLAQEPELRRFAIEDNYIIRWDVDGMVYETKWGSTVAEPKFTVTLYRKMYDENGKLKDQMILVQRLVLFEDEVFTKKLAHELDIKETDIDKLMNVVRYERIKRWLLDVFQAGPHPRHRSSSRQRQAVIDGKPVIMVDTEEVLG